MSYPPYESYLSNLDSLVFDAPSEVIQSEKDVADELDLWSNAQFTFDVKPGVGIYDEEKTKSPSISSKEASDFESASGLDPVTYNTLVNYLDYELPRQQEIKLDKPIAIAPAPSTLKLASPIVTAAQKPKRIQPRPLAPALPILATAVAAPLAPAPPTRQILMPKPPTMNATILASLMASAAAAAASPVIQPQQPQQQQQQKKCTPVVASATVKRSLEQQDVEEEDGQVPDEDKRRRNTAASARFRVKKKMREQAMEQSVREMTIKSDVLQDRVNHLESEIQFLRSLLLDKAAEQQQR